MEIITSIKYDGYRHALVAFVKKHVKIMMIPMVHRNVVHHSMNNRNMVDAIAVIMQYKWIPGILQKGGTTGQSTYLKLAGGVNVVVHLIINSNGDKLCLMDINEVGVESALVIGFVGEETIFKSYMNQLNITDIEIYNRVRHLVEEEV